MRLGTLEISSSFRNACNSFLSEARSIFGDISSEFSGWQDQKGRVAQEKLKNESEKYKAIKMEAKSVLDRMNEIENIAEKVKNLSCKNTD